MYKKTPKTIIGYDTCIIRVSDGAWIPFALDNTDYQAYLVWLSEGNEPLPADEPNS